jgi:hypothetical protein
MSTIKRVKELVLMLALLVLGGLIAWFIISLSWGKMGGEQTSTGVNLLAATDLTGPLKSINDSQLVMDSKEQGTVTVGLNANTQYQIRNPHTYMYDLIDKQFLTSGQNVFVELDKTQSAMVATAVKTDYPTSLGGKVVAVEGNQITLQDYLGTNYTINTTDTTEIFIRGQSDALKVSDILVDKNIVVSAGRAYEVGQPVEAGYIEILDESAYQTSTNNASSEGTVTQ